MKVGWKLSLKMFYDFHSTYHWAYLGTMQKYQELASSEYPRQLIQHTHPWLCHCLTFLAFWDISGCNWWRHQQVCRIMAQKIPALRTFTLCDTWWTFKVNWISDTPSMSSYNFKDSKIPLLETGLRLSF